MTLKKITFFAILFCSMISYSQENNREIYSVEILKIAQENGRHIGIARLNINKKGIVKRMEGKKGKLDINTFTKSINKLVENDENVLKVDGDNNKRTGIQDPHNQQHIYISVIYQDDYERESFINKTCYRYREIDLPVKQSEYSFFKYFNESDLTVIKSLLR